MVWEAEVVVSMNKVGDDNMPLDLKDVSDLIDDVDHALLLNVDDSLLDVVASTGSITDRGETLEQLRSMDQDGTHVREVQIDLVGDAYLFWGDPTCEVMSQWMADRIRDVDGVEDVRLVVNETDKYGIETWSNPNTEYEVGDN